MAEALQSRDNGKNTGAVGYKRPPVEHQFKPGNPGRVRGSRNKLGEDFIHALAADFEANGTEVIEKVRAEDPTQYLKVIASVIPKEVHHTVEDYDSLSDEELEQQFIAEAGRLAASRRAGSGKKAARVPAPLPN